MEPPGQERIVLVSPPESLSAAVDRIVGHRNYFFNASRRRLVIGSRIPGRMPAVVVAVAVPERPPAEGTPITSWLESSDVQHLLHIARHADDPIRRGDALIAVARGPAGFEARGELAEALASDPSAKVRAAAVGAFAQLEAPPLDVLLAAARNDPSAGVRRRALALLHRVADPEILERTLGEPSD